MSKSWLRLKASYCRLKAASCLWCSPAPRRRPSAVRVEAEPPVPWDDEEEPRGIVKLWQKHGEKQHGKEDFTDSKAVRDSLQTLSWLIV